ncbi:hypothetical protein [Amycolatopsis sp. FDAARGOS 1241]|uniref:hypothetical protein n=1 Tax=Amycolatopsis sp. FDAARGOS 1241 TaxID=2778070 RepID=UPI001EF2BC74|nr:hypothetical protein [Amycolatopsis sp. FDAARGOS 1241]
MNPTTATSTRMQAITIPEFDTAQVLRFAELDVPPTRPRPGVSRRDPRGRELRRGPLPAGDGRRAAAVRVAGRIRALGPGVDGLRAGQPVAALTIVEATRSAEVAVTSADLVVPLDDVGLSPALAAALPSNSTTASLVLDRIARIEPGESVLVHAAAGGVGSQPGQAARLLGRAASSALSAAQRRSTSPGASATTRSCCATGSPGPVSSTSPWT